MANYTKTTIKGNTNKDILAELKGKYPDSSITEDSGLWIRSRGTQIIKDLIDKSLEADDTIEVAHVLESEQYGLTHVILYDQGLCIEKDIYINYWVSDFDVPHGYDRYEIEDKIVDELKKYDSVNKTDKGLEINDNLDKKIIYEYKQDGNYKFVGTKKGKYIEIKTYEINYEWREFERVF